MRKTPTSSLASNQGEPLCGAPENNVVRSCGGRMTTFHLDVIPFVFHRFGNLPGSHLDRDITR